MACSDPNDCPPGKDCKSPWELTKSKDSCYIDKLVEEHLDIGAADVYVFKLLGLYEQQRLVDLIGKGSAISGGDQNNSPAINAFMNTPQEWRSLQKGSSVLISSFIGYDFGPILLDNGKVKYGITTSTFNLITSLIIQQGPIQKTRATRIRVERSDNGTEWFGADIVNLVDDSLEHEISLKQTVPSRFWRLRPITFNGIMTNDFWVVNKINFIKNTKPSLQNVMEEDYVFLESRNRDYSDEPIVIKGYYDLLDTQSELSRFGIELPSQMFTFQINFNNCVKLLGRPIVVGDIFEIPSEVQYTPELKPVKKYLEVLDCGWSSNGFTPGWKPTLLKVVTQPAMASQETQDIFGDLAKSFDSSGLFEDNTDKYQNYQPIADGITNEAKKDVPERGADTSGIATLELRDLPENNPSRSNEKVYVNSNTLYVEDGIPPEGRPYTEGDILPTNPSDKQYHRLTYSQISTNIPPRLYRFSTTKNRWIYLETDRRSQYNNEKPILTSIINSSTMVDINKINEI